MTNLQSPNLYSSNLQSSNLQPALSTRAFLWQLLRYKPGVWLLTVFAYMILYGLNFAPPLIARAIFDRLTGAAPVRFGLWTLVLLLFGSTVGRQAAYVALIAGQTLYTALIDSLVRANLLAQLLNRPGAQAIPDSPGETLSRFRDDIQPLGAFFGSAFNLIGVSVFALLAIITMIRTSPLLTLVAFLPLLLLSVIINRSSARIMRLRAANQAATSTVTGLLGELFGAAQAIKVADAEAAVMARLDVVNETRRQAALQDRLITESLGLLGSNLGDLGTAIILLLMGQAMRTGTFTVGDFALFVYVMPFVANNMGSVAGVLTSYRQLGVSLQRLTTLLQTAPTATLVHHRPLYFWGETPAPATTVPARTDPLTTLSVANLTYHFPQSQRGISDVSFTLPQGTFTVITGPVGSGKSTLLRVLLGLLPRDSGEIRWNGELVADPGAFFQPPRSAYTPQAPRLFSDSLRENILLGWPGEVDLATAIHSAVLEEDVAHLAQGLDTLIGPRGVRLSGGQMQRTAAARMFVRQPDLLVFDDLSSALDVETEGKLWERLLQTQGAGALNATYLVVSHRPAALARADQVITLNEGRIEVIH
jgi:ATP-binding cassette subfamily B protein